MNYKTPLCIYEACLTSVKRLAIIISGLAMIFLVFSFAWLVYGRYVLNDTPTWVEQLSLLLVITISFLTAAIGIHERTHLSVDLFTNLLPEIGQKVVTIFADLIMAIFGLLMAIYAFDLAEFAWPKKIPLLGITEAVRYVPVVISGSLIFIFSLDRIVHSVCNFKQPAPTLEDH